VQALLDRYPGRPGTPLLRRLAAHAGDGELLSDLEAAFLAFTDAHGLPRPLTNHVLDGWKVDAYWPQQGVVVEVDSAAYHHTRHAFERDREKIRVLTAAGSTGVPITDMQLEQAPALLAADLHRVLARCGVAP
jgi:hypothetical protein